MLIATKQIEVRYAETDQMGVVYHANYLVWMEIGRTALVEELGFNYGDMEKDGIISPVMDISVSYKQPVRYGEETYVRTWIEEYDGIKVIYGYEIVTKQHEICATGTSRHVLVKKENFRPISMKRHYPDWDRAYESAKK